MPPKRNSKGQFVGGSKGALTRMNTSGWDALKMRLREAAELHVRVGLLSDTDASAAEEGGENPIGLVALGAIHEFGSKAAGVPERSYLRRTFRFGQGAIGQEGITRTLAKGIITGKLGAKAAYEILGHWAVKQVRETITAGQHIPPPLAQSTIDKKGSDRPLVDTGRLVGGISHAVEFGGIGGGRGGEVGTTSTMGPIQEGGGDS